MNADILEILSQYGQSTTDQIKQNLSSTGTNASGKTSRSLRFEVIDNGSSATLRILGKPYFMVVETGRKPTPQYTKPSFDFVNEIRNWLAAKGRDQGPAYAIAKNIHKEGTQLWQKGGRQDIVSNVVNEDLFTQISRETLSVFANEFLVSVVQTFKDGNRN